MGETTPHTIHRPRVAIPTARYHSHRRHENQLLDNMNFVHQGGQSKGKSKGEDGGKGFGPYQTYCRGCGMWSHSAKFDKQQDAHMDEQRRLWSHSASNVDQHKGN